MESTIIETLTGMTVKIIPKQEQPSPFDPTAIQIKHISYYDPPYTSYEEDDITEDLIAAILAAIPQGINIYLSLNPYGEDELFEINCDGKWLAIGFSSHGGTKNEKNYYSYNPEYAESTEFAPVQSGGQSPIEKYLALTDIEIGVKAVEYFIRTGKIYPCIDWAEQL